MSDLPQYYTTKQLAKESGLSVRRLLECIALNSGKIQEARFREPGVGLLFEAKKCAKFLAMRRAVAAGRDLKRKEAAA